MLRWCILGLVLMNEGAGEPTCLKQCLILLYILIQMKEMKWQSFSELTVIVCTPSTLHFFIQICFDRSWRSWWRRQTQQMDGLKGTLSKLIHSIINPWWSKWLNTRGAYMWHFLLPKTCQTCDESCTRIGSGILGLAPWIICGPSLDLKQPRSHFTGFTHNTAEVRSSYVHLSCVKNRTKLRFKELPHRVFSSVIFQIELINYLHQSQSL